LTAASFYHETDTIVHAEKLSYKATQYRNAVIQYSSDNNNIE